MRILVVHNDYGRYSGEEAVVDRMIGELRQAGHTVDTLRRSSEGSRDSLLGNIHGFLAGLWSISGRRQMRRKLRTFRPDLVHIHNLYPFISPAVLPLCRRAGVRVEMTVHNYRLICPTGLFLRDNRPCENCLRNGNERDCIRYNCEQSLLRSLGYALRNMMARRTRAYIDNVDYYRCLTQFQRRKLIEAGFDGEKIGVFPNRVDYVEPSAEPLPHCEPGYVGYVGRLSPEKGYDLLLEVARRHPEMEFRFAGFLREGEAMPQLPNVRLCGQIGPGQLARFYADARFIVVPSRCYEGFPMVLLEAASHGKPCVAPSHGAFPELMSLDGEATGRLFRPLDVDDLERNVVALWQSAEECERLGALANKNYQRFYKQPFIAP